MANLKFESLPHGKFENLYPFHKAKWKMSIPLNNLAIIWLKMEWQGYIHIPALRDVPGLLGGFG